MSAANGIQESGGRQTHSRGRKPPVWGKENRSPEAPERTRRQRGPTENVALNMPCAHIRSRRSWLRAYALALSVGLPRLRLRLRRYRAPYHFHALPGVLIFGYASMNHPRLFVCRPPDSKIPLAYGSQGKRSLSIGLHPALKARAVSEARLCPSCGGAA